MQPNENSEYISELKKLVNENVISEVTAQIHLSDLRKGSGESFTPNLIESQQAAPISPVTLRNRRLVVAALTLGFLSLVVAVFVLIR